MSVWQVLCWPMKELWIVKQIKKISGTPEHYGWNGDQVSPGYCTNDYLAGQHHQRGRGEMTERVTNVVPATLTWWCKSWSGWRLHLTSCQVLIPTTSIISIIIFIHTLDPHDIDLDDYDQQQVAERAEEERCQAEKKAEKPGRGETKKKTIIGWLWFGFSDN